MSGDAILVTGGAGYVGSHVCKALARAGWRPVVYDNLSHGHDWAVKWGPLERGDLADTDRLAEVMTRHGVKAVAHLAGLIAVGESVREPLLYWRNNVSGSESLLSAMARTGVRHLVFSSTCAVYGEPERQPLDESFVTRPVSPYAWTKLAVERMLADCDTAFGLKSVCLRYFNAAGADPEGEIGEAHDPETHLIPLVLEAAAGLRDGIEMFGDDYPTPDGTCVRDYVHVADIAQAHLLALDHLLAGKGSLTLNLGSGHGFSVREVIEVARKVTGRHIPVRQAGRRAGDPPVLVGDARRAQSVLGWQPRFPDLQDQVAHAWAWLKARKGL
ncbi:MAG TPA: UDP-glucose 4-epimerase GalE [Candidatus Omnitrophota bacterium]|nr:UDP-glucose 4-epimerase GalE [Candidatus Omnitrophota bacterium]